MRVRRNACQRTMDQRKAIRDCFERRTNNFNRLRVLFETKDDTTRVRRPSGAAFAGPEWQDRQSMRIRFDRGELRFKIRSFEMQRLAQPAEQSTAIRQRTTNCDARSSRTITPQR